MPQARSGDSKSRSGAKTTSGRAQRKPSTAGSSAGRGRATRSSGSGARSSSSTSDARSTGARSSASSAEARLEGAAERVRKLNERIIEASKQTGETTLSSYEKALKAIASAVERGPGSSDIEWISNLATVQAKFIRDVTEAWTSAARDMLK
jgi:capsid protein